MEEDEELERIKRKKLKDMIEKKSGSNPSPIDKPMEVTDATFSEIIARNPLVVIDCWAAWCAPCRMIAPIIEELAKDYAGKILFGKLNVDENQRVPTEYQILSIPTLLIFKKGQLVDRIVGVMPRKVLEPRITRHI